MPASRLDAVFTELIHVFFTWESTTMRAIIDSHKFLRISSFVHIDSRCFVNSNVITSPSYLKKNGDSSSGSTTLPP